MSETEQSPEKSHIEYGAVIDRTSKGLGCFLAEVSQDRDRIESIVSRSEALFGFPGKFKTRTVTVSEWTESAMSTQPGGGDGRVAERERFAGGARLTSLDPENKSGHYVDDGPCWCGDVHYYREMRTPSE